jgi:hypothetical protein
VVGVVVGLGALVMLLMLAGAMGQIKAGRLWPLLAGVGTGVLAGFILANGLGGPAIFAAILAVLAIGFVVGAVVAPPQPAAHLHA